MPPALERVDAVAAPGSLSVLIISFNCWKLLDACLRSLERSGHAFLEIVVIDNASVDGTVAALREQHPRVRVIVNATNVGHARAVNQGFREVRGDLVLLLDADTEIAPDAVDTLVGFLAARSDVSMVAPRTFNTDGTVQESARSFPSAVNGLFGRQSVLTRWFPNNRFSKRYLARDYLSATEPYPVEQISAACMLFRRRLLTTVGEWDEGYAGYFVDTDWCRRVQKASELVYCVPRAHLVHHEQNKPWRKKNPSRILSFHRGAFRLYRTQFTYGWLDPRALAALVLLGGRCALLLAENALKKADAGDVDPLSTKTGPKPGGTPSGA